MNYVDKRKILHLVQFVFNSYISEDYKNLLLNKYKGLSSFISFLNEFILDIYNIYYKDKEKLDFYLEYIANNYLDNKDISIIKEEIVSKLEVNFGCSDLSMEDNHKVLGDSLIFICRELNKRNIDYYVVGSIPIYIKINKGFERFHSDIDIMINGNDIDCLKEIFEDSDYILMDNRFNSHKFFDEKEKRVRGGHDILAQCKDNDFSIGFYEFSRYEDGSISKKDYFSDIKDNKITNYVYNNIYTKEYFDMFYSKDFIEYNGIKFRYFNIDGLYLYKSKNLFNEGRNKDLYDVKFMEKNCDLDKERINELKELFNSSVKYIIDILEKK